MMQPSWVFPSNRQPLENDAVVLSAVEVDRDLDALWGAASLDANGGVDLFRYHVNVPPMVDKATFRQYLTARATSPAEVLYQVFSKRLGRVVGCASFLNIRPEHGTIEVGSIWYTGAAQRTEVNTNAMFLLFCQVFDTLGYRRLEWKCNDRNQASKTAALRLGFTFEGLFRHHFVSRGENRDTAWFSIIDDEWADKKAALKEKLNR